MAVKALLPQLPRELISVRQKEVLDRLSDQLIPAPAVGSFRLPVDFDDSSRQIFDDDWVGRISKDPGQLVKLGLDVLALSDFVLQYQARHCLVGLGCQMILIVPCLKQGDSRTRALKGSMSIIYT
jgi:hypothetical protein